MTASQGQAAGRASHQVHVVIYPGFKSMEAVGPVNVLSYANRHLAARGDPRRYDITLAAPEPGAIPSDTLISLEAGPLPEGPLATVMVAGALDIQAALARETGLVDWCRRRAFEAERFAALCSGSFFLAAAGVLDGRRAATHWSVAELLQRRFPKVRVDADAIFVQDGSLWTSAGVTAAIDLALAFVEQDNAGDAFQCWPARVEPHVVAVHDDASRGQKFARGTIEFGKIAGGQPVQCRGGHQGSRCRRRYGSGCFKHFAGPRRIGQVRLDHSHAGGVRRKRDARHFQQHHVGIEGDHTDSGKALEQPLAQRPGAAGHVDDGEAIAMGCGKDLEYHVEPLFALLDITFLLPIPPGKKVQYLLIVCYRPPFALHFWKL